MAFFTDLGNDLESAFSRFQPSKGGLLSEAAILPKIEVTESTDTYGCFIVEPLERGFGNTLGNALRRVLLGSLLGAAVTWIKIEGIQHEFSVIPHIQEDTVDFLLNVRTLRLRPLSRRPSKLTLEVEGEGQVHAADIKPSADFEIVNPDLHLATLDSFDAKLSVEFNVELGRGYVPADSGKGLPIGVIPVDAIFTPVRRVDYNIQPARVEEGSGYERLVLEVWTDATISPPEAVSQGAYILMRQLSIFRDLAELTPLESKKLPVRFSLSAEQYDMPLEQLELSTRTLNCLKRSGITTVGQFMERGEGGLLTIRSFGQKSREEMQRALEKVGLQISLSDRAPIREGATTSELAMGQEQEECEVFDEAQESGQEVEQTDGSQNGTV